MPNLVGHRERVSTLLRSGILQTLTEAVGQILSLYVGLQTMVSARFDVVRHKAARCPRLPMTG